MKGGLEYCVTGNTIWFHILTMVTPITPPETLCSAIMDVATHFLSTPTLCHNNSQSSFASCLAFLSLCWPSSLQLVLTFLSLGKRAVEERIEFQSPDRTVCIICQRQKTHFSLFYTKSFLFFSRSLALLFSMTYWLIWLMSCIFLLYSRNMVRAPWLELWQVL